MREHVLIAGVSVRNLAESAVRAGYSVTAVDGFGDLDLRAIATEVRRVTPYTAASAANAACDVQADAVCYVSNFENHPQPLRRLQQGRALWGNSPSVLARARDPFALADVVSAAGLPTPRVRQRPPRADSRASATRWLVKPHASGGGHGVIPWLTGATVSRSCFLQERVTGRPGSVLFAADGQRAIVLGVTRQLIGDRRFGSRDFRFCGNLLAPPDDPDWGTASPLANHGAALATLLTRAFGLVGVNGIDVIVNRGRVTPIELNPRHTAAMELLERRDKLSVFSAHVAACRGQWSTIVRPAPAAAAAGKAIVFARRDITPRATERWLADPDVRDVPAPGIAIPKGAPICTVFATARTVSDCYAALVARAERIHDEAEELANSRSRNRSFRLPTDTHPSNFDSPHTQDAQRG